MTSYAVLGGTGQVGGSVLKLLLDSPDKTTNIYVRSKQKLFTSEPRVKEQSSNVQIYEGQLDDIDLLTNCIRGTKAVFMTVAAVSNIPGCHSIQRSLVNWPKLH